MSSDEAILASYEQLRPTPWSEVALLSPVERASRFFLPTAEDAAAIAIAHAAITPFLQGSSNLATSRVEFLQRSRSSDLSDAFDLAAQFYHSLLHGARNVFHHERATIQMLWPSLQYLSQHCCPRCSALDGCILVWRGPAIRRFCPPWHLSCQCWLTNSTVNGSPDISAICDGDDQYLCNPIDLLVAYGFITDFSESPVA